jgi:hypothetical protein
MVPGLASAHPTQVSAHEEHRLARPEIERSGLRSYRKHRLELGDILRAALHLAHSCGDDDAENQARDLLARLAADRFRLAVTGQFSRGKSTLMNALLSGAYLPMGALPMTSVITTVRYGTRPKAMIRRHRAAPPVEVPLAQVADYVAGSSVRRAEMRVATVEVEVPAEILRLGFEFIDTPGVGSAVTVGTAATWRFLPRADAVIFVTGFDSPLTEAEADLLADAFRQAGWREAVMKQILPLSRARKCHGGKVVLDDLTLGFLPGAKISVVGPNGMCKTTVVALTHDRHFLNNAAGWILELDCGHRWFLDRVATHILAWAGGADWFWFEGNFAAYEENKTVRQDQGFCW